MKETAMNSAVDRLQLQHATARDYSPPAVATLVAARNIRLYERMQAFQPSSGWGAPPAISEVNTYPSLRPGLLLRELGDSLAIHDPLTLDTHSLNEAAASILLLCNGIRNLSEIAAEYSGRYNLPRGSARSDTMRIIGELLDKKVLIARTAKTFAS
jgi:hypothetical protein